MLKIDLKELLDIYSEGMDLSEKCQSLLTDFVCAEVHPKCVFISPCKWIWQDNTKMHPIGLCVSWIV